MQIRCGSGVFLIESTFDIDLITRAGCLRSSGGLRGQGRSDGVPLEDEVAAFSRAALLLQKLLGDDAGETTRRGLRSPFLACRT